MNTRRLFADVPVCVWCVWLCAMSSSLRVALGTPLHRRHHHSPNPRHTRRELHAARTVYGNPCGGRRTSQEAEVLADGDDVFTPLHHQLLLLSRDAALAKKQVSALMQKYLTERFQRTIKHDDFSDFRLKGLPKVPKVKHSDFYEEIEIQVHTSLNGTYDRLVTMDMFLHDIRLDETHYHGELGYARYVEVISNTHITNLLCRLRIAMVDFGVHYNDNHVRKAMRHEVRDVTSTALRYISDYIILRELENALTYMELEFAVLRTRALETESST